ARGSCASAGPIPIAERQPARKTSSARLRLMLQLLGMKELVDGGLGHSPLAADFLALEVARVETRDNVGFGNAQELRDLGWGHQIRRGRRLWRRGRTGDAGCCLRTHDAAGLIHHLL